jgi:uncharacterized membrane protein
LWSIRTSQAHAGVGKEEMETILAIWVVILLLIAFFVLKGGRKGTDILREYRKSRAEEERADLLDGK